MNKKPYILFAALLAACSANESFDVSKNEGEGSMAIVAQVSDGVDVTTSTRSESDTYTISADLIPAVDDLKLSIYQRAIDETNSSIYTLYQDYASLGEYDTPNMPAGDYTAIVTSASDINEESETNAFFADSLDFTITKDVSSEAAITATLANSIVQLQVTDQLTNYFAGGVSLKLSTEAGATIELDFPLSDDTQEKILFVAPNTALYLEGTAIKQDPGTGVAPSVTFTKTKVGVATSGMMNRVVVDAAETGGADITVTIDDTIIVASETTVDVNSGTVTTETIESEE